MSITSDRYERVIDHALAGEALAGANGCAITVEHAVRRARSYLTGSRGCPPLMRGEVRDLRARLTVALDMLDEIEPADVPAQIVMLEAAE